jgi:hypothetical protein
MDFNTIPQSIELMGAYETEIRTMRSKLKNPVSSVYHEITLTLNVDSYTLYFKCDKIENSILLSLPASTCGTCNPLKLAFSKLCTATKFRLKLEMGVSRSTHVPDWLLQWMHESRSHKVPDLGFIGIHLGDTDAIRILMALLVVDLSKKNDDTMYAVKLYPQSPKQVNLYLDTMTKYNTRFAVKDRKVIPANFNTAESISTKKYLTVYRNALMHMVEEYNLPGITGEMINIEEGTDDIADSILWSVSVIIHYKATVNGIVDAHQDLFESQTALLRQMLAKSLKTGKSVYHPIVNLTDDDFNNIHTNHRQTLGNARNAALEQVREIVLMLSDTYVRSIEEALHDLRDHTEDTITQDAVKNFIMPEEEDQVAMMCKTCGLLSVPIASIMS